MPKKVVMTMVAIVTEELAPVTMGYEEQVNMYAVLDYIELAVVTMAQMRIRKRLVYGMEITNEEKEKLRAMLMGA